MSPAEMQEAADELRVEIINAARIAMACGEAIPPGVARIVEDAKNPRPDWRDMLRRFVSKAVEVPVDQTWARPNRRFIHQGIYLPGWRKEGTNNLLMVIDSSSSTIRTPALPRFYAEMKRILADTNPDSVTVMWCDSVVRRAETYTDPSQIPQICPGGGGTRFSPVWRKVEEMNLKPSGCVFFTDLVCHDFGTQPDFPVLWAKWGKAPIKPPFGDVLDINQP
jgi:predicted metal-dependent peptidase